MQFASRGSLLLEQKLSLARQRMFLFADDQVPPTPQSKLVDVIKTINKARSFSQNVSEGKMSATRLAGFANNRYLFGFVENVNYGASPAVDSATASVSMQEMFMRFYAVGRSFANMAPTVETGSVLDNTANDSSQVPPLSSMIFPCFDTTVAEASFAQKCLSTCEITVQLSDSASGNIGTVGNWSSSDSSAIATVRMPQASMSDSVPVALSQSALGISAMSANVAAAMSNAQATDGMRVLYGSRTNVYGTRYFSGGGWTYNTTYFKGCYTMRTVTNQATRYFAPVTHADTPAYKIKWGMLPFAFDLQHPCVVQILTEGVDFTHSQEDVPGAVPVINMIVTPAPLISRTVFL